MHAIYSRAAALVIVVAAGACKSSYSDAPADTTPDASTSSSSDGGGTAAPDDAEVPDAATEAAAVMTTNLVPNADFEQGCANLIPHPNATVTPSTDARSGTKSCKVCATSGSGGWAYVETVRAVQVGSSYFGAFWYKTATDAMPWSSIAAQAGLDTEEVNDAEVGPVNKAAAPSTTWQHATTVYDVTKANGTDVWLSVVFDANQASRCVLVDDIELDLQN